MKESRATSKPPSGQRPGGIYIGRERERERERERDREICFELRLKHAKYILAPRCKVVPPTVGRTTGGTMVPPTVGRTIGGTMVPPTEIYIGP